MRILLALLIALVSPASASYLFNDVSNEYGQGSAPVTALPLSLSCFMKPDDLGGNDWIAMSIGTTGNGNLVSLGVRGDVAGDPTTAKPNTATSVTASAGFNGSLSIWRNGVALFINNDDRTACFNGGNCTAQTGSNQTFSNIDTLRIGAAARSGTNWPFSGRIAECAVFNVTLTADEYAMLANWAPNCMKRRNTALEAYYRMHSNDGTSVFVDYWGAVRTNLTQINTPTASGDNPLVIRCDE